MKSPKELDLEQKIMALVDGKTQQAAEILFSDPEVQMIQDYANTVSIKRLGYNDHGPVHMRIAALNALKMFHLLSEEDIAFNLEQEGIGTRDDSRTGVLIAALLHDLGMSISRNGHENNGIILAKPIIERTLAKIYPSDMFKQVAIRSLAIEGIYGHMATHKIHSLEAGLVLIGDGCDMAKGRARIPSMLSSKPKIGDIHRYSSSAIEKVIITHGESKPIRIAVEMNQSVGFHQIEEVLYPKIKISPVLPYIELFAGVRDKEQMQYL
jgi:metal-dependent HD superfamily phosphatase/phosphodiesterase